MSFDLPGGINPFEAPRAGIGEEALQLDLADDEEAELIRREHLGHEANIRSLGRLGYLVACFTALFTIVGLLMASGVIQPPQNPQKGADPTMQKVILGLGSLVYLVATVVLLGLGYGLTRLQVWARWTSVVLASLALIYIALMALAFSYLINPVVGLVVGVVGGIIGGLIIALLALGKSGMVFSAEYREVIRKTPLIKRQTSVIAKVGMVLVAAIMLGLLAVTFGGGNR